MRTLLSLAIAALITGPVLADPVIYSQSPSGPIGGAVGGTSINDDVGQYFRAYDNFQLSANFSVTDVHWFGQYTEIGFGNSDFGNVTRATAFDLLFYSDNAGVPGTLLQQVTVPIAQVNEYVLGTSGSDINATGIEFNQYDTDISSTPFDGFGGVQYWLAIVADLPTSDNNLWDWRYGVPGDGIGFQDGDVNLPFGQVEVGEGRIDKPDFAFSLTGTVVPEPGSIAIWLVVGYAGIGIAVFRRRASKRRAEQVLWTRRVSMQHKELGP